MGSDLYLSMRYDVYADMSNASSTPYILLSECELRTAQYKYDTVNLSNKVPATVQVQISGTGASQTVTVNGTPQYHQGQIMDLDYNKYFDSYRYIRFSSPTRTYEQNGKTITEPVGINIPKNGQEFTITITVRTKNNAETYTIVEHAAGPMSNTLSGPSNIYTGRATTYTLGQSVTSDGQTFILDSYLNAYFEDQISQYNQTNGLSAQGFSDNHTLTSIKRGTTSSITFAPLKPNNTPAGSTSVASESVATVKYRYHSPDLVDTDLIYRDYSTSHYLLLTYITKTVTVTTRNEIDSSLRPEFISFEYEFANNSVSRHVEKYGACIQNQTVYSTLISGLAHYGYGYASYDVMDYKNGSFYGGGSTRADGGSGVDIDYPGRARFTYDGGLLDTVISNGTVEHRLTDRFGNVTTYRDTVTTIAYHNPTISTHNARRCSLVSSGSGSQYYTYNGNTYKIDDNGSYVLIEWAVSISPLNNINSRGFTIMEPKSDGSSGTQARTITLTSYNSSGYYVTPANPERSYDIVFTAVDDFHPQSKPISITVPLNTAVTAIDFMAGGTGLSFGKIAELNNTFDVHRNWIVNMPYDTQVMNYTSNGGSVRIRDWMDTVDSRIQAIIDHRDILVYRGRHWGNVLYDNNTISCIPSGYGTISDTSLTNMAGSDITMRITTTGLAGMLIGDHITLSRNYLHLEIGKIQSFIAYDWNSQSSGFRPAIYIMGSKPTTINQSTGAPNGTILKTITTACEYYTQVGSITEGYAYWLDGYNKYYIDVSSLKGRSVWVVIVAKYAPGTSPNYGVELSYLSQTNTRE